MSDPAAGFPAARKKPLRTPEPEMRCGRKANLFSPYAGIIRIRFHRSESFLHSLSACRGKLPFYPYVIFLVSVYHVRFAAMSLRRILAPGFLR